MLARLKQHYDGYHFSERMTDVYNPFSLLNAFAQNTVRDYWFASGTPTYLIRLLSHSDENLDELTGKYYDPSLFVDYKADVERPLPMIYQSGYLTIKDYKRGRNTFLLDFPNNEVKRGFVSLTASNYFNNRSNDVSSWIQDLLDSLEDGDSDRVRDLFTSFLADIPYTARRKENERERERYFQYTFYLIFKIVSTYTVTVEQPQSQGRVDCIVETVRIRLRVQAGRLRGRGPRTDRGTWLCTFLFRRQPQGLPHRSLILFRHRHYRGMEDGIIQT